MRHGNIDLLGCVQCISLVIFFSNGPRLSYSDSLSQNPPFFRELLARLSCVSGFSIQSIRSKKKGITTPFKLRRARQLIAR